MRQSTLSQIFLSRLDLTTSNNPVFACSGITYNFVSNGGDALLDNGGVLFLSPISDQDNLDLVTGFEARVEDLNDFR